MLACLCYRFADRSLSAQGRRWQAKNAAGCGYPQNFSFFNIVKRRNESFVTVDDTYLTAIDFIQRIDKF